MGSSKAVQGKGMCTGVIVGLPGLTVVDDFLPLELGNLDMVLGMQWLQKQGAMMVDWKDLAMTFTVGGVKVVLKGDLSLIRMEVSLKMLMKQWHPEDKGFLVDFRSMGVSRTDRQLTVSEAAEELRPEFEQFEREFADIFDMPAGLPPLKHIHHRIQLKEGTNPINVRPSITFIFRRTKLRN